MADQYDVTEGQCPEDCPDVEVATYCINELQQVQNISRVNVKKCCPEDCPCDGEYNSEGCTLCGKCDGHPGFDLPKTFCVADTQPAQNVMRVNVNKDGDDLWEIGEGNTLQPKENKTFTIKKANEVNVANGSTDRLLNEKGEFVRPSYFYYGPTAPQESKKYDIWTSSITLNQYQFIEGVWIAFVPIKGLYGIIDGNSKDTIYLDGNDNKNILIDGNKDDFVIIQDIIY